jgi:hypothetical protein
VSADCGVTNLRITYCGGWMDGGGIDVSTHHGGRYTCAEKDSAFALPVFIVRLLFITSRHRASLMFPD